VLLLLPLLPTGCDLAVHRTLMQARHDCPAHLLFLLLQLTPPVHCMLLHCQVLQQAPLLLLLLLMLQGTLLLSSCPRFSESEKQLCYGISQSSQAAAASSLCCSSCCCHQTHLHPHHTLLLLLLKVLVRQVECVAESWRKSQQCRHQLLRGLSCLHLLTLLLHELMERGC
jgi:hypothetical protein